MWYSDGATCDGRPYHLTARAPRRWRRRIPWAQQDDRPIQGVAWAYRPVVKPRRAHGLAPLEGRFDPSRGAINRWGKARTDRIKRRARLRRILHYMSPAAARARIGNQISGAPRHRRDASSSVLTCVARWRGVSRPSTRHCPVTMNVGSKRWRFGLRPNSSLSHFTAMTPALAGPVER